ncbi:MAG: hypothetical protein HFI69_07135 [Lachnospiraceae bacterium]|nr:hypothetical protein [Lachnospiraceae bacterium]
MQNDDVRAQLIRAFPAEVIEARGTRNEMYYACPTCGRAVAQGMDKCTGCSQVLSWKNINEMMSANGMRKAVLEFEVASDFTNGNCRKCPLSYIGKGDTGNVYECPLDMRSACPIKLC